jgi:hypothetical protein
MNHANIYVIQIWDGIAKGPKYVGSFTSNVFSYLEGISGVDSEIDLQKDCSAINQATGAI